MLGTHDLGLFVLAGLLLNITPGPDMLYIIGRGTSQGWRAGAAAALGVGAGCFVHIAAAALGVSALITASATAFVILKIAGAIYLTYVGVSMIVRPDLVEGRTESVRPELVEGRTESVRPEPVEGRTKHPFIQGFLTNALNPKVALFFLAFLPQFISADATAKPLAFLLLGVIFTFNGTLWNLFVAWGAARMGDALGGRAIAWMQRCIGFFLVVLGVRLALEER
jgi:threonine/homoserine/homoserine lactone efflux protein